MSSVRRATTVEDHQRMWQVISVVLDSSLRLPEMPFRSRSGCIAVGEDVRMLGADCVPVLNALCAAHGDDEVVVGSVDPSGPQWYDDYGFFPVFAVAPVITDEMYWEGVDFHLPGGAGVNDISDVLALAGSSGRWGAWVERDWELSLVWAVEPWDWSESSVPFERPRQALHDFAHYPMHTSFAPAEVESFVRNVEAYDVVADTG